MSKFLDGLKATATAVCPCCLFNCEMAKEAMESEIGLRGTHGIGEAIMVCLEEQLGSRVWKNAVIAADCSMRTDMVSDG